MSASLLTAQEPLGLFELDAAGKVLYHRSEVSAEPSRTAPDMTGTNFYDDVARFENVENFRRCVAEFISGSKAADSFDFDCHYEGSNHPVRVLLARICEHLDRDITRSVLVHIRRVNTPE